MELVRPDDLSTPEIISYASGDVIRNINSPDDIVERRQQTIRAVRTLNEMWQASGGERRVLVQGARFRGRIPGMPDGMSIAAGSIEGTATKFEPWIYNDVRSGVVARYLIMLTIEDAQGVVNLVGAGSYKFNEGEIQYKVDLAHSVGPIEEVA